MIVRLSDILAERRSRRATAGAFTSYNLETAVGVVRAAAARRAGVILLVSGRSLRAEGGDLLLAALRAVAERAPVPACVQLDHVSDLSLVERAFDLGAGAVMADGSGLPFEENAKLVRAAAAIADRFGGEVEAELGHVGGDEDVAGAAEAGALTDPDEAASFVERTGAACLAVSIGNVHGIYRRLPQLDWSRLAAIRERVAVPLALHGASGLPPEALRRAVSLGVAKVNVNTELRQRYFETLEVQLAVCREGANLAGLGQSLTDALEESAGEKLDLLEPPGPVCGMV